MSVGKKFSTWATTGISSPQSETMDGDYGTGEAGRQSALPALRHSLRIPLVPKSPNGPEGLLRMFWAKRANYNKYWVALVREAMGRNFSRQPEGVMAYVYIRQNRKRLLDRDNAWASLKPVIDALVNAEILIDDDEEHALISMAQKKCGTDKPSTIIEIRW